MINKCVVWDIHHCVFGSHWRKATRSFFRWTVRPCLFSQSIFLQFPMPRKVRFLCLPRREQTYALAKHSDTAICDEISATTRSLHCRAPNGTMTHLKLALHFGCELRFWRSFWRTDNEFTPLFEEADLPRLEKGSTQRCCVNHIDKCRCNPRVIRIAHVLRIYCSLVCLLTLTSSLSAPPSQTLCLSLSTS